MGIWVSTAFSLRSAVSSPPSCVFVCKSFSKLEKNKCRAQVGFDNKLSQRLLSFTHCLFVFNLAKQLQPCKTEIKIK